ncbi:hypothetical protein ACLBWS_05415 [Brucellaceae bacterium D45D]
MTISKSDYVDIKAGQYALVFQQPFGPYDRSLQDHMAMFVNRGGGWDSFRASELFDIHFVCSVSPNTYKGIVKDDTDQEQGRYPRSHVIAGTDTTLDATILRDQLFSIGEFAEARISLETRRQMAEFTKKEREYALQQIHGLLPHIFGGAS